MNGVITDLGVRDDGIQFLNTLVGGDRRARVRLPGVHDPADLRGARPHGPGADRGRQGPLRHALEHVPARDDAGHLPGRAGRLPCSSSCRRSATSSAPSCSAGPSTYMVGNLIQQQFLAAENWPFGAALTAVMMAFLLDLDGPLPALRGTRGARGRAGVSAAAEGLRPPALPARRSRRSSSCSCSRRSSLVALFSFNSTRSLQNFEGFSLQWYERFFDNESLRDSLIASIEIALVTMVVATVLGTLLAFGLVRARTRWAGQRQRADADPARDARDRRRRLRAAPVHADRHAALADDDHDRPHHVLDLVRDGGGARPARGAQPEVEHAAMDLGATRCRRSGS